jgi:hypothetical protein
MTDTPLRDFLISATLDFVASVSQIPEVKRVALIGSICTGKPNPKDVDVLLTIAPEIDMANLAGLGRRLGGKAQSRNCGADIFLADLEGRYLGRTCHWKICKPWVRMSCRALNCGSVPYLNDDLQNLMLRSELISNPNLVIYPQLIMSNGLPKDLVDQIKGRFEKEEPHRQTGL